jgi:hypothetical protein
MRAWPLSEARRIAQLSLKKVRVPQEQAHAAQAHERVRLGLGALDAELGEPVAADVGGADHDRARLHRLHDRGVDFGLLFFRRRRGPVQEEIFGPEQPNALGLQIDDRLDLLGRIEVRLEPERFAVERLRGQAAQGFERLLVGHGLELDALVFLDRLGSGADDDHALLAVENHHVAGLDPAAHVGEADDGGNLQGLGEDRGVRGLAAQVGGEA